MPYIWLDEDQMDALVTAPHSMGDCIDDVLMSCVAIVNGAYFDSVRSEFQPHMQKLMGKALREAKFIAAERDEAKWEAQLSDS